MSEEKIVAAAFEENRAHLLAVADRMLGSRAEAEDAVQEAWLRVAASDTSAVGNVGGFLTVVVARICLDQLRKRKKRREDAIETHADARDDARGPDEATAVADSIGLALLVVLETLEPSERVAFVLHDLFDLPFEEIAPIVGRTPTAARQLASRARRRVQGAPPTIDPDRTRQKEVVSAFLAASRGGDFAALLAVLDANVVLSSDAAAVAKGGSPEIRGANDVATFFLGRARAVKPARIEDGMGAVFAVDGAARFALRAVVENGSIARLEAIADETTLAELDWDWI